MSSIKVLSGNEACALGAIAAGMNFFAGYPITPATEIAEICSELLVSNGGVFMQMEDELSAICSIVGASMAGARAMTATSGPGFSLMQEGIGLAVSSEAPCVIIDVMRRGPNQGVATMTAQGDLMQTVFGSNGDHPAVVLAPFSVEEMYIQTVRAFCIAEELRTPVIIISDASLAHISETVCIPDNITLPRRKEPTGPIRNFKPCHDDGSGIPSLAAFGDGRRWCVSSLIHDEDGFPSSNGKVVEREIHRLMNKIEHHRDELEHWDEYMTEDADLLLVSVGVPARSAMYASDEARKAGVKVGVFRPITLWPFPERRLRELYESGKKIMTCEMNCGQLNYMCRAACSNSVYSYTQNDGYIISADSILTHIKRTLLDG